LSIDFNNGFSAITGETGAGKSILIGALSLILGKRADTSVLFDKDIKCVVEGFFDISSLKLEEFFKTNDLDYDENTILRREISVNGKSRAFINDTPVTASLLKDLGSFLVDIHSQHETLNLNKSAFQLEVIDRYGTNDKILEKYALEYKAYKNDLQALQSLKEQNESSRRDEEYYKFQFNELELAQLNEDEINILMEKEKLLSHAEEVNSVIETSDSVLVSEEDSTYDKISKLIDSFGKLSDYHASFKEIYERLKSVNIELKDIAEEIDNLKIDGEFDAESLETINDRLNTVYSLQQKHSVSTVSELIDIREDFNTKLNNISNLENEILSLENVISKRLINLKSVAKTINGQRLKSAKLFAAEIAKLINKLGMPEAEFVVDVRPLNELTSTGMDIVEFLLRPNKGGNLGEISKIASGGELSRIMLAVKSLITNRNLLPTIIFDEIDSGVSGDIAAKVGNLLKQMSENHQLICITHLPQIAAKANSQYFVFKENKKGKTSSNIILLNDEDRVEQIAKMLSDERVSDSARETAKDLMNI